MEHERGRLMHRHEHQSDDRYKSVDLTAEESRSLINLLQRIDKCNVRKIVVTEDQADVLIKAVQKMVARLIATVY